MDNLKTEKIEIQSTETKSGTIGQGERKGQKWVRISLKDTDGKKFSFFTTKSDGSDTKAFEFYKAHKQDWDNSFLSGGTVETTVMFAEEEKTFTNNEGKNINYTARDIKMFEAVDDGSQPDPDVVLAGDVPPPIEEPPTVEECNVKNLEY